MFQFVDEKSQHEKCYTAIGQLPAFIDPKQPPHKKPPFSSIRSHPFIHTTELILPESIFNVIWPSLDAKVKKTEYARVILPLRSLLEGEFFTQYIKIGNILMISEGRSGVDEVYMLHNGVLSLELSKEVYERTGLTGKPIRSGGRKHAKERYLIELDLRLPSMLHGKKGFERIVWTFKNVLTTSVSWLFCDLGSKQQSLQDDPVLAKHYPQVFDCDAIKSIQSFISVPPLKLPEMGNTQPQEHIHEYCLGLAEWLALLSLKSPRVSSTDNVDPYISRYAVPEREFGSEESIVSLKWHGLGHAPWVLQLFISLFRESKNLRGSGQSMWFALSCNALGRAAVESKDGYTILYSPTLSSTGQNDNHDTVAHEIDADTKSNEYRLDFICWEFVGASV